MSGLAPTTALWSYAPTIIGDLGYNRLAANAMTSVGQWISVLLIMMAAYVAYVGLNSELYPRLQSLCLTFA